MNDTEIKTRLGLILQGVLGAALAKAGFSAVADHQYEPTCEKPDFLIPDATNPKIMIEVHQTEARNSFQMKTLRAFTAVTESKAYYGNEIVSVNVLFGNPDTELPPSNVRAMGGIFDVNILAQKDSSQPELMASLEQLALEKACEEGLKTEAAIEQVIKQNQSGVKLLAKMMKAFLIPARPNRNLFPLFDMERDRTSKLGDPPTAGAPTYYKRMMLRALFLSDEDFEEILKAKDPNKCTPSVQKQLVRTGLATLSEELDGDYYTLDFGFEKFLRSTDTPRLKRLCKDVLDSVPEMHWFFEDIRDAQRRNQMAEEFWVIVDTGRMEQAVLENLESDNYAGISHRRCWVVDLAARYLGVSHNRMNAALRDIGSDPQGLGNPFNQLSYKSARFMSAPDTHEIYATGVAQVFETIKAATPNLLTVSCEELASRLLELRLDGAIKLRKLDPLLLVATGEAIKSGLSMGKVAVRSIVSDLARVAAVGRFEAYAIGSTDSTRVLLVNAVAVHDHHGDDKSKEWGARRLATLYRIIGGKVKKSEYQEALFVIDGEWADKDVTRLHRCGWNRVVRLGDLEKSLAEIFGVRKIPKAPTPIPIFIPEEELPMAAEDEELD